MSTCKPRVLKSTLIAEKLEEAVVTDEHLNIFEFSNRVRNAFESSNAHYHNLISRYDSLKAWDEKAKQYSYLVNEKPHVLSYELAKKAGSGVVKKMLEYCGGSLLGWES